MYSQYVTNIWIQFYEMEFKDFLWNIKNLRKYSILFDIKSSGIIYDLEAYWLAGKAFITVWYFYTCGNVLLAIGNFNWNRESEINSVRLYNIIWVKSYCELNNWFFILSCLIINKYDHILRNHKTTNATCNTNIMMIHLFKIAIMCADSSFKLIFALSFIKLNFETIHGWITTLI